MFEAIAASIALVALSPVLAVVAIVVRLRLGSPVLFRQVRPGLHGQPFAMLKFRTMRDDRDEHGTLLADEFRLTRVGNLLRATSLDELPELVNVVKGDMGIVGPRPLLLEYLEVYTPDEARRHDVRPGITGLAQINGRNAAPWPERFALDLYYVDHQSLWLDLRIIARTVAKVVRRDGIAAEGYTTAPHFTGTAQDELAERVHA